MATKILFPIAGSKSAQKVLPKVADMAEEAQEQKVCETYMAKAAADLKDKGLNVDFVCVDGLPARQIAGYAKDKGYDLIVMAGQDVHELV
jgi:nucleotide-binding universal stress UspA family protein